MLQASNHNTTKPIAMVVPWYGSLPKYFPLFLKSLYGQPFDLLLITDQIISSPFPPNLIIIPLDFESLKQHIESVLNTFVIIPFPYKLCDFKPAYGLIFSDLLRPYRFWGTIDIDMVLGNLASYFTDEKLDTIDFFSGLLHYVAGSFFFIRNYPQYSRLFMKSKNLKEVLSSPEMFSFTECNKHWHQLIAGADLLTLNTPIESFTEILLKEKAKGMRVQFENLVLEPKGMQVVEIKKHGIFYLNKEYLLLHLLYFKTRQKFTYNLIYSAPPYYINSFGTFKRNPKGFWFILAPNWAIALYRKVIIQWDKIIGKFL